LISFFQNSGSVPLDALPKGDGARVAARFLADQTSRGPSPLPIWADGICTECHFACWIVQDPYGEGLAIGPSSGPGIESPPWAAFHRSTYPSSSSVLDLGSPSSVKKEPTWPSKP
jgi:hypothetical protein